MHGTMRAIAVLAVAVVALLAAQTGASPVDSHLMRREVAQEEQIESIRQMVPMTPEMEDFVQQYSNVTLPEDFWNDAPAERVLDEGQSPSLSEHPEMASPNREMLRAFAKFAAASYCMIHDNLRRWTCGANCKDGTEGTRDVVVIKEQPFALKGWMGVNDRLKAIIVSFRGTLEPQNFVTNLAVWRKRVGGLIPGAPSSASVHQGFWSTYNNGRAMIHDWLNKQTAVHPDYKVYFTGHSLGAALATIAAMDAYGSLSLPKDRIELYSFGEPRVGNKAFSDWVHSVNFPVTRYTYEDDVIPHIPLRMWGYQHHALEIYEHKKTLYECRRNPYGEDPSCSLSRFLAVNMVSHLRALDIVFGPWC